MILLPLPILLAMSLGVLALRMVMGARPVPILAGLLALLAVQALIDRVYLEVFEGRWQPEWETLLDDPARSPEDKLTDFYVEYVNAALSREFVRIFVFSGLTDHTITDRFFSLLRQRLFTRLIRETRRFRGVVSRARASERETELLMGLHGGFFYIPMRRWIYAQGVASDVAPARLRHW